MPLKSIRAWLGVDRPKSEEFAPLRETLEALDHLEPERARYLAAFAYLLGRVAHADQGVSAEETSAMEALVRDHGQLPHEQAMIVVQLAKTSNLLFGGTANFLVAREFSALATYEQKLALMRCLFELSATDEGISTGPLGRSATGASATAAPPGPLRRRWGRGPRRCWYLRGGIHHLELETARLHRRAERTLDCIGHPARFPAGRVVADIRPPAGGLAGRVDRRRAIR